MIRTIKEEVIGLEEFASFTETCLIFRSTLVMVLETV